MEKTEAEPGETNTVPDQHYYRYCDRKYLRNVCSFKFLEQKTVISDLRDNDKVLTEAELRAAVDLLLVSASATGSLSLDDYNQDQTDDDYFKLRQEVTLKYRILFETKLGQCQMNGYISQLLLDSKQT